MQITTNHSEIIQGQENINVSTALTSSLLISEEISDKINGTVTNNNSLKTLYWELDTLSKDILQSNNSKDIKQLLENNQLVTQQIGRAITLNKLIKLAYLGDAIGVAPIFLLNVVSSITGLAKGAYKYRYNSKEKALHTQVKKGEDIELSYWDELLEVGEIPLDAVLQFLGPAGLGASAGFAAINLGFNYVDQKRLRQSLNDLVNTQTQIHNEIKKILGNS